MRRTLDQSPDQKIDQATLVASDANTSTHHPQFHDYLNSIPQDFSSKKDVSVLHWICCSRTKRDSPNVRIGQSLTWHSQKYQCLQDQAISGLEQHCCLTNGRYSSLQ